MVTLTVGLGLRGEDRNELAPAAVNGRSFRSNS